MEYVVIAILLVWIIMLYVKIDGLKKVPKKETIPLKNSRSKDEYKTLRDEPDYLQFEKQRLKEQKSAPPEKPIVKKSSSNFGNPNNDLTQEELLRHMGNKIPSEYLRPKKNIKDSTHYFYGKKVCITGEFKAFPVRAELAKYLWELGTDVDTQVGPTLDYLICGDYSGPSKCAKAKDQGVEIIYEDDLIQLLPNFKSKYL